MYIVQEFDLISASCNSLYSNSDWEYDGWHLGPIRCPKCKCDDKCANEKSGHQAGLEGCVHFRTEWRKLQILQ